LFYDVYGYVTMHFGSELSHLYKGDSGFETRQGY